MLGYRANYIQLTMLAQQNVGPTLLAQHVGGQQKYIRSLMNAPIN